MEVRSINKIGKRFIKTKNNNFLSLRFNLNLNLLTNKYTNPKKGNKIANCFKIKIVGNFKWLKKFDVSKPVLFKPYVKVIKLFAFNQNKWGTSKIINTSIAIKYLKSNLFSFLKKMKYKKSKTIDNNK